MNISVSNSPQRMGRIGNDRKTGPTGFFDARPSNRSVIRHHEQATTIFEVVAAAMQRFSICPGRRPSIAPMRTGYRRDDLGLPDCPSLHVANKAPRLGLQKSQIRVNPWCQYGDLLCNAAKAGAKKWPINLLREHFMY
ncbi:hypothetical protein [Kaistia soli]|uniref:hypothetical protein n=1 Tax=Kaistia soli TaxID=446684 RepID=UPI0011147A36|nr:hypothetical protein [Kaistia soli]